jgi:DNA primase
MLMPLSISISDLIGVRSQRPLYRVGPHRLRYHCWRPSHPDDHPSGEADELKQLAYCFVCDKGYSAVSIVREWRGCSTREAIEYLAGHGWQIPPATILPLSRPNERDKARVVARGCWILYRYRDASGIERYQILRTPDKQFLFRHVGPDGELIWNGEGIPRLLYKLYAIQGLRFVFIVEGEKDTNTLWAHGLPAVTNPGGAGKWRDGFTRQLCSAGVRHVVILPDNDSPGRDHAGTVARSCRAVGLHTRIVHLPVPPKGDVSDYLGDHNRRDLLRLLRRRHV